MVLIGIAIRKLTRKLMRDERLFDAKPFNVEQKEESLSRVGSFARGDAESVCGEERVW
jgi:hypothetical protein